MSNGPETRHHLQITFLLSLFDCRFNPSDLICDIWWTFQTLAASQLPSSSWQIMYKYLKKKSPGRNKEQLGNVLMLPEHYQLDPACRCCVIGLPTATLRRQPVIKGPSKSLSMITRAVGLQGWGCCWNAGKRWETCCICRISLGKSSNYTKKGFTFTSFEYQIGCSQWLWFC